MNEYQLMALLEAYAPAEVMAKVRELGGAIASAKEDARAANRDLKMLRLEAAAYVDKCCNVNAKAKRQVELWNEKTAVDYSPKATL